VQSSACYSTALAEQVFSMIVNRKRPKILLPVADGLTNVVVYSRCTATCHFSSRAAFRVFSVTSVGISAPMITIHSYTKADKIHHSPKDGVVQVTRE